jgi:hypothetical protein
MLAKLLLEPPVFGEHPVLLVERLVDGATIFFPNREAKSSDLAMAWTGVLKSEVRCLRHRPHHDRERRPPRARRMARHVVGSITSAMYGALKIAVSRPRHRVRRYNCAVLCPDAAESALVWIYDEQACHGYCRTVASAAKRTHGDATIARVGLDGQIRLEVREASLGEVAGLIAQITDARIYVPADRMEERRTLHLYGVSLEAAVRELELMAIVQR